jgi:putative aldouronate transport system permease protein
MCFVLALTLYPFIYVLSMSLSAPVYILRQDVWLLPKGFSVEAYARVLSERGIWLAYWNTAVYTVAGTALNVTLTAMLAYPLSKRNFWGRNAVSLFVGVTMLFNAGMIPNFLLINRLGLYNNRLAMIIPGAISVYNMIIARTFFSGIPESLEESAALDGANHAVTLARIILPISKPVLAALTLFYAVAHWNTYFNALLYLPDLDKQPLQMYLVRLLVQNQRLINEGGTDALQQAVQAVQSKYATIVVVIAPILCVYPFLQKYFVQGVMIGAIKE